MKRLRIVLLVLGALLAATTTLPAQEAEGVLECEGDGLIQVVPDECMHDGGGSAAGDSLEVYCHLGTARFCLSGEACPWRGGETPASGGDATCSRAGLDAEWMATAWCDGWSGFHDFSCTERGQIKLRKEGRANIPQTCSEPD